ncbi:MAG: hypothetical protein ACKPJO_29315, partial [Dolichospermum sp.]
MENINTTVNTINTSIGKVTNSLSNGAVDAAKEANSELDKLNQTVKTIDNNSKSWIESFSSNFTNLFKAFENGFSNLGNAITNVRIKTSSWIEGFRNNFTDLFKVFEKGFSKLGNAITNTWIKTSATGQRAIQNLAGSVKEVFANPIGFLKKVYKVDKSVISNTIPIGKGKAGFVENSRSSINNQRNSLPATRQRQPVPTAKLSQTFSPTKLPVPSRTTAKPITKQSPPVPKFPNLPNLDPRIDTKFLQDVSKIAQSVGANPEDLLKVMLYETGGTLSPSIRNPRTKATGLIQFMPATAKGLGTNIDALSQMTPQK